MLPPRRMDDIREYKSLDFHSLHSHLHAVQLQKDEEHQSSDCSELPNVDIFSSMSCCLQVANTGSWLDELCLVVMSCDELEVH